MRQEGIFIGSIGVAGGSVTRAVHRVSVVLSLLVVMCGVMSLSGSAAAGTLARPAASGRFESDACSKITVHFAGRVIAVASIPGLNAARCGFLVVPENRARPTGRTIRLAVAVVPP